MIPYRAMLDVPAELLRYLSRLLAAERRHRGTPARSRKLSCRDQALLALRWFRDRTRIEALGRDHGISRATAYRYVAEAVDVLSAQAPSLPQALERAMAEGVPVRDPGRQGLPRRPLLRALDQRKRQRSTPGTPVRRTATAGTSRPSCARTASRSGSARPSPARSTTSPPPAARPPRPLPRRRPRNAVPRRHRLPGRRNRHPHPGQKPRRKPGTRHRHPHPQRAPARPALPRRTRFALLTQRWAALQHITADPGRITEITRAALVLTQFEHKYIS